MKSNEDSRLNRREFVKSSVLIAGSAFSFRAGLREVVANSMATGSPLLTAANLNQKFAQARTAGTLRAVAANIKTDPILWLRTNYSLTEAQSNALRSIPESHWTEIKRVLAFVENNRGSSLAVAIHESLGGATGKKCNATIKVVSEAQVGAETLKAEAEARTT